MKKIHGKFAPLTDELGYDPRFKGLTVLEKLLYLLIIHTTHMTHHQAPTDPRYYQLQYGLRAKSGQIVAAIRRLTDVYPKLRCTSSGVNKTLSLLNSPTYKIGNRLEVEEEIEREVDIERDDSFNQLEAFNSIKDKYPKKIGSSAAMRFFFQTVLNEHTFKEFENALDCYLRSRRVKEGFILDFHKWIEHWADWIDFKEPEEKKAGIQKKVLSTPKSDCEGCGGSGKLPDGIKCWCW